MEKNIKDAPPASPQEVWKMLREVVASQKEATRKMQESERKMQESERKMQESERKMQETANRRMKETERLIKESSLETDRKMQETDKKINRIVGEWGNQWGNLAESLTRGGLVPKFKEWGIKVEKFIENLYNDETEFDFVGINGKEIVAVEVKATLRDKDVQKYKNKIAKFKTWWPELSRGKMIFGGMACLKGTPEAKRAAEEAGFFVLDISGDVTICNSKNFKPQDFS